MYLFFQWFDWKIIIAKKLSTMWKILWKSFTIKYYLFVFGITYFCVNGLSILKIWVICTKLHLSNKKILDYTYKNLSLLTSKFPLEIIKGVLSGNFIFLFAHRNAYWRTNYQFGENLGLLYYESITSPFLLWKLYIDIMCQMVFNFGTSCILSTLNSSIELDCFNSFIVLKKLCWY